MISVSVDFKGYGGTPAFAALLPLRRLERVRRVGVCAAVLLGGRLHISGPGWANKAAFNWQRRWTSDTAKLPVNRDDDSLPKPLSHDGRPQLNHRNPNDKGSSAFRAVWSISRRCGFNTASLPAAPRKCTTRWRGPGLRLLENSCGSARHPA
jgi:hypothetical protein